MAERIRKTAIDLDVDCTVLTLTRISKFRSIAKRLTHLFVDSYSPDIVIALEGGKHEFSKARKYAALTHGSDYYFSQHAKLPFAKVSHYDGFLVGFPDRGTLKTYYSCSEKNCNYMNWFSTCQNTSFNPPKNLNLFYCGSNMAGTSAGPDFMVLFSMLDQQGYLNVYGGKSQWHHTPNSYRGYIKHDGNSIIQTINQTGIALVLHAPDHFQGGTPTGKIFEAAAASSIIISDRHPFITKYFGDTVLYVDRGPGKEMFDQINEHVEWIRSHPEEATALAKRSHEIFVNQFTLEDQLKNLISLHENLSECKIDVKTPHEKAPDFSEAL